MRLMRFSHNKEASFKQSCDALRDTIDAFVEHRGLGEWYDHFEKGYSIPAEVIKHQMKWYLESKYNYRDAGFSGKLMLKHMFLSLFKYTGLLLYSLCSSKKYSQDADQYKLIVEWIENSMELRRFSKLINLFGTKRVLITAVYPVAEPGYNIIYRPMYRFYDRSRTLAALYREMKNGLNLYIKLSLKLGLNLVQVADHIIHQYLYYYSIFRYNRSGYCIQERHYQTSAVKNFLFHKFGGVYSGSIQKNIHQMGKNGFYYDIDVFFSLGNRTADRALEYGGRIRQTVPVGSMFMEYYWFGHPGRSKALNNMYDIVYIGINVSENLSYLDAYSSFQDDYYETYRWLTLFAAEKPGLRIGIKHHTNNRMDHREMAMINGTSVERIEQSLDSYEVAFQSKCCVTFGSTMGYELIAHGLPTLFLDPGCRSALLPGQDSPVLSSWRVTTYEDFRGRINEMLSRDDIEYNGSKPDDLCLNSENVSERIHEWFHSSQQVS